MDNSGYKKYLAEAVGTAVLVLVGCGAVTLGNLDGRTLVNVIGIAFSFGLAVTAMAYGIGPISGCHINPAVTVAMLAAGRMQLGEAIGYVIAQCVGAIVGAGLLLFILSGKLSGYDVATAGLGQNGWGEGYLGGYGMGSAIAVEFLATLIFLVVILGATNPTSTLEVAGLIIGDDAVRAAFPVHQCHRPVGQSGPQPWPRAVRRRQGAGAALAVPAGAAGRRRGCRLAVQQPAAGAEYSARPARRVSPGLGVIAGHRPGDPSSSQERWMRGSSPRMTKST